MTDPQSWVAPICTGLADLLAAKTVNAWDTPSLCDRWLVRHVVAHMTMPARLTPEQFGAEMAAAGGSFAVLSNTVAARDAELPVADLLDQLRSPTLHAWQPPRGRRTRARSTTPSSTPSMSRSRSTARPSRRPPRWPPSSTNSPPPTEPCSGWTSPQSGWRPTTRTGPGGKVGLYVQTAGHSSPSSAAGRYPTAEPYLAPGDKCTNPSHTRR